MVNVKKKTWLLYGKQKTVTDRLISKATSDTQIETNRMRKPHTKILHQTRMPQTKTVQYQFAEFES